MWFENDFETKQALDMGEIYRQNYEDALDEIRNLRCRIAELEVENKLLRNDIDRAENFIYHHI
jgi:hypothetical protein